MKRKIGFIGAGNMGFAIISGIVNSGMLNSESSPIENISAYELDTSKCERLKKIGVTCKESVQTLADSSDVVFLCVKPQNLGELLESVNISPEKVIISICAGVSADFIRKRTNADAKIILVMPNTPLMLGLGASALAKCSGVSDDEFELAVKIFSACGCAVEIPETKMKEIIAINGSSPAFIYLFAKAFCDYAKGVGISEESAAALFSQSLVGSAKMITDSGMTLDELIKMVSSPGGTTIAGLSELYEGDFEKTVINCCEACTKRAYELGSE